MFKAIAEIRTKLFGKRNPQLQKAVKKPKVDQIDMFDNQLYLFDKPVKLFGGETKKFGENDERKFDPTKKRWVDADAKTEQSDGRAERKPDAKQELAEKLRKEEGVLIDYFNRDENKKEERNRPFKGTVYDTNYAQLETILGDLSQIKEDYRKVLKAKGYQDFDVEYYGKDKHGRVVLSMSHWGEENGDLMSDPRMEVAVDVENHTVEALTFENHYAGVYKEVYDDMFEQNSVNLSEKKGQNSFLKTWLKNIIDQGHKDDSPENWKDIEDMTYDEIQDQMNETVDAYRQSVEEGTDYKQNPRALRYTQLKEKAEELEYQAMDEEDAEREANEKSDKKGNRPQPKPEIERMKEKVDKEKGQKGANGLHIYHDSFTSACTEARSLAERAGYTINDDDWFREVATRYKAKPDAGQTSRFSVELYTKKGNVAKKALHFQVYGLDNNGRLELNAYIS